MKRFLICALVLVLGACTKQPVTTAVYDSKKTLLVAEDIAVVYLAQPPCAGPAAVTCVDPGIKAKIKAATMQATKARKAVDQAVAIGQAPDTASMDAAIIALAATVAPYAALIPKQ